MFEEKKKMSNAKLFALTISIGLHVVLFYYLGKMALDYALPKGEVTSYEMTFDNKTAAAATNVDVIETKTPAPTPPLPTPAPVPKKVSAPKSLPTKEAVVEDKQGEMPVATEVAEPPKEEIQEPAPEEMPNEEPTAEPVAETEATPTPPADNSPTSDVPQISQLPAALGATPGVQSDTVLVPLSSNRPITYPTMARFRKLEGITVVHYNVSADGSVTEVNIVQSSGFPILDNQAVDTIKNWKFKPTGKDGVYERPIRYSLKGDAREAPSQLRRK